MSEISDAIQAKCLAFSDRIIKLNDYLLEQASQKYDGGSQKADRRAKTQTSYIRHQTSLSHPTSDLSQPSYIRHQTCRIPVHLQAIATLCNQLLRSGTSIGANNAEATNAVSKTDYRSKSYIALKEARESLYWIDLLHRNEYIDDRQYESIYTDAEELVKIFVARCKKLDAELNVGK